MHVRLWKHLHVYTLMHTAWSTCKIKFWKVKLCPTGIRSPGKILLTDPLLYSHDAGERRENLKTGSRRDRQCSSPLLNHWYISVLHRRSLPRWVPGRRSHLSHLLLNLSSDKQKNGNKAHKEKKTWGQEGEHWGREELESCGEDANMCLIKRLAASSLDMVWRSFSLLPASCINNAYPTQLEVSIILLVSK